MKILTVGDGNFSFSLALARFFREANGSGSQLTATSHETKQVIIDTYPESQSILDELKDCEVILKHGVDATDRNAMKELGKFDRIIWNFPCIRKADGADGQNEEMEINKRLVHDFYVAAVEALLPGGELHLTHKTKPPFEHWGIVQLAENTPVEYEGSVVFDRCLYPNYSNKKVLSKKSFPIWDSQTFIFSQRKDTATEEAWQRVTTVAKTLSANTKVVFPLTAETLETIRLKLKVPIPRLKDDYGAKKRRKLR